MLMFVQILIWFWFTQSSPASSWRSRLTMLLSQRPNKLQESLVLLHVNWKYRCCYAFLTNLNPTLTPTRKPLKLWEAAKMSTLLVGWLFWYSRERKHVHTRTHTQTFSVFLSSPAVPPSQLPPLLLSSSFPFPNLSSLTFVWSSLTVCRLQSPPPVFLLICRLTSCCHASLSPTSLYSFSLSWLCVLLHFLLSFLPHPLPELFFLLLH